MHLAPNWGALVEGAANGVYCRDYWLGTSCWAHPCNDVLAQSWKRMLNRDNVEFFKDTSHRE